MKQTTTAKTTTDTTAKTTTAKTTFETLKRNFETDTTDAKACLDLATACAYSVLAKCIDPQRKTAQDKETVSNSGYNPAMVALRRGVYMDRKDLASLEYCADVATETRHTQDGDAVQVVVNKDAKTMLDKLVHTNLSDGIDLVQTAALALLEQAAAHSDKGKNWLDCKIVVRRLSKRVYVQKTDSAAYKEVDTTPIQEVYRAVRRAVQDSRAIRASMNGYTYIADTTTDQIDTIYFRLGKYADLGGYDCNGNYTADRATVDAYESTVAALNLTERQAQILKMRMQGHGYKAIATYFGVTHNAVVNAMKKVQAKAEKIGFTPSLWAEMTA